ncbi:MAG: ribosomal RNA small subunit methyltransferase I [Bacteriovoracaceae bacterium]
MGKIILLNTPIGNLGDLTPRVLEALRAGETFAVEDTRVFKELLNHLGISIQGKKIFSLHDQSEKSQIEKLIELAKKEDLYVASEAGSPIISDPAYPLVLGAYQAGLKVESYSGVSSPIMALELSGLPPIPFHFHGFLPREAGKIKKSFEETGEGTHIFFEAPTRIEDTLKILSEFEDLSIVVVRELSKKFEEVYRFSSEDLKNKKIEINPRGEFILLFHKKENSKVIGGELRNLAQEVLNHSSPKSVAKLLAQILDRPTKEIYDQMNRQK